LTRISKSAYHLISYINFLLRFYDNFQAGINKCQDWFSTLSNIAVDDEDNAILYPSVSANFIFSDAFEMPSWLTFGKIRGSWAQVGGDTDPYNLALTYGLVGQGHLGNVNQVRDIEDLYTRLQGDPESINLFSIVRIWRAVIYQRLTDLYGDIPYSEAGKGFIEGLVAPKYETQEFIYMDMLSEISQAVESFDASRPTFGSADVVFGGDIDKW
jgi:hypothetical protein